VVVEVEDLVIIVKVVVAVVVVDTKDHVVVAVEVNKVDNFAKDGSV
jgi:hypothetical protein